MIAFHFPRWLPLIASIACASALTAAHAQSPQTFTAKAVVAILGPKEGLSPTNFEKTQAAAQKIITGLLPGAEKRALQQLEFSSSDGLSVKLNAVPDSLVFELHATAPTLKLAADFANNIAGQLEQSLPKADPAAVHQLEVEIGQPPILLIFETAKPSLVTQVEP
jgi:hypothetical protein